MLLLLFGDQRPVVTGLLHGLKRHQQDVEQKLDSVLGRAQLEFTLEDLEAAQSARSLPPLSIIRTPTPPARRPLPAQLPREEMCTPRRAPARLAAAHCVLPVKMSLRC